MRNSALLMSRQYCQITCWPTQYCMIRPPPQYSQPISITGWFKLTLTTTCTFLKVACSLYYLVWNGIMLFWVYWKSEDLKSENKMTSCIFINNCFLCLTKTSLYTNTREIPLKSVSNLKSISCECCDNSSGSGKTLQFFPSGIFLLFLYVFSPFIYHIRSTRWRIFLYKTQNQGNMKPWLLESIIQVLLFHQVVEMQTGFTLVSCIALLTGAFSNKAVLHKIFCAILGKIEGSVHRYK